MIHATHSGFPKKLSQMIAQKHREDYRKEHGTNPPSLKETLDSLKTHMENRTPKDWAALAVRMAEADVAHFKMFSRTPMERIEADDRLKEARRRYENARGKETPRTPSLREKVCKFLEDNIRVKWRVKEIAAALDHPPEHVGVVVGFLRKEGKYPNIIK